MGSFPPFFHKTENIYTELESLSSRCSHMEISNLSTGKTTMKVVNFGASIGGPKKMKVLLYFGEHSREMISPESALDFARHLCYEKEDTAEQAKSLLMKATIRMVPIVNHDGRKLVESGDFCHRTNAHNVDLNRNWDEHWQYSMAAETYPGEQPFSETETQILKKDAEEYKPNVFLTVHSGTLGLFTPWAYCSTDPASLLERSHRSHRSLLEKYPVLEQKQKMLYADQSVRSRITDMKSLLDEINPKYCRCEAGAAGVELPYLSPGTSMDWMFDKLNCDYAFAFEIYDGRSTGGYKYSDQDALMIQEGSVKRHSCFSLHEEAANSTIDSYDCFLMFNPSKEDKFTGAMDNWSKAYLELFQGLAKIEQSHGRLSNATLSF
mmetsp:Transcript_31588/g.61033  ORF Transcript_31588/g.61033 Transcript_31588/m.61033 type:complete len:379 (+) Transcript_31588:1-1137(+)